MSLAINVGLEIRVRAPASAQHGVDAQTFVFLSKHFSLLWALLSLPFSGAWEWPCPPHQLVLRASSPGPK